MRYSSVGNQGQKSVLLEIHKADDEVLLSDFDLRHYVLNQWYIADNEKQYDDFLLKLNKSGVDFWDKDHYPSKLRKQMMESWQKIFDMQYKSDDGVLPFARKSVQATFWQLSIQEVKSVRFFTAR